MSGWGEGYVTETRYVEAAQQDALPARLSAALALRGLAAPDFTGPFRALDLGCGSGLTALGLAAAAPQAEVLGVDFSPAQILSARAAAQAAGADNARFEEASFEDLLARPEALGAFDLVICHGVLSWVSAENRARVVELIRRHAATGALVYLGYNALPGWAPVMPFRALVARLARTRAGRDRAQAIGESYAAMMRLAETGAGYMRDNAPLRQWLEKLPELPPDYLAHEYLPEHAEALWHDDVAASLAPARLDFAAAARLAENLDDFMIPEPMREIVADAERRGCGEFLRDLCANRTFRADIFARGAARRAGAFDALQVAAAAPPEQDVELALPGREPMTLDPALTGPLLSLLADAPDTLGGLAARAAEAGLERGAALQAALGLLVGGQLDPLTTRAPAEAAIARCRAFNAAAIEQGWPALASPRLGGASPAGDIERDALAGAASEADEGDAETRKARAERRTRFACRKALFPAP